MAASTSALQHAKGFMVARDFKAAIELLSTLDDPSPVELCALADAYLLSAYNEQDDKASKVAYAQALQLYSHHHADHPNPTVAYRGWAVAAYALGDEKELIRAKEEGLRRSNDDQLIFIHYMLKRDRHAPEDEREELVDQMLELRPNGFNGLTLKASFLIRRREWKKAWQLETTAVAFSSDWHREHPGFPMHLIRSALLALIQGQEWQPFLLWAQDIAPQHALVKAAEKLFALKTRKQQTQAAKQSLEGHVGSGGQEEDYLEAPAIVEPVVAEHEELPEEEQVIERSTYTQDHIERMGPVMREKIIVQLLAKAIRMGE